MLTLLAGGTAEEADAAAAAALDTTGFWVNQWTPGTSCTACGRAGASGPCVPGGRARSPVAPATLGGAYGTDAYGGRTVVLAAGASSRGGRGDDGGGGEDGDDGTAGLTITWGPIQSGPLDWSNTSLVMVDKPCTAVADTLIRALGVAPWAVEEAKARLGALQGPCTLTEWIVAPEIGGAGVSVSKRSYYTLCTPFIHLHCRTYTYIHPLYLYTHL